ncbi:MAG: PAS domain-containing sensor histidine kinase, partial [Caldimonas sp.]
MPKAAKVQQFDPPRTSMERRDPDADRRARIAVDSASAMLWMADAQRRYEWFNAACTAYTGRPADELRGDGWLGLVHLEDIERCSAVAASGFETREPYTLDYRLLRHDGEYRWMLEHALPRFDADGAFDGYTGSVAETHPRKLVEARLAEELQSLRLAERRQSTFLATLSHELRNPLAPIANAASMLRSLETGNPTLARLRQILERQVSRLGHLVEDLIDATRAAQGQISLVAEQVTADTLVRNAVAACADSLNDAGHTLDVQVPDPRLAVKVDLTRMTEALAGIIGNAVRFTLQPGVISLEVRRAGSNVEIGVRDPGVG